MKSLFTIFKTSLVVLPFIACGPEESTTTTNLTGSAPATMTASNLQITVYDEEQTRTIELNNGDGTNTYDMTMIQWVEDGDETVTGFVNYRGTFTYTQISSTVGRLSMVTTQLPNNGTIDSKGIRQLARVTDPSTRWDGENLDLIFQNGSVSGSINSTKYTSSGTTQTLGGTFSIP